MAESTERDKYFILLVKSKGYIPERGVFKAFRRSWIIKLERGTILEEQPCKDPRKKTFAVVPDRTWYLDCEVRHLADQLDKLTDEAAEQLLKIGSPETRFQSHVHQYRRVEEQHQEEGEDRGDNESESLEDPGVQEEVERVREEKTTEGFEDTQMAIDIPRGLEMSSMVEVPMSEGRPRYGVIRWIGNLPQVKDKLVAGLELEEEQSACSDGIFNGVRYFTCPAGRGFFTLLMHCRQDSRSDSDTPATNTSFHVEKDEIKLSEKDQQEENSRRQLSKMEQRVKGMEQQLREKDRELENSERLSREREQHLTNFQRQLREKELQEAIFHEQLREKEQQEENSQRQLMEIKQLLREKDEQEENLQGRLREMEQQLREEEDQTDNLQRQLREMEQQLTNLQRQFREKGDETANLQEQVTTQEQQLRVKDQQVNELEVTLSTAQQALSEHQRRQVTPDWVTSRDQIQLTDKLLGRGGWGSVVEGKYCGCAVAVKQIHELILSPHNRTLFEREMDIASRCRHPCLLQFIGATNDEGSPLFVTELMESSLRALLEQRPLSATEVSIISLDVARALNYLHQKKPPIVHRDISSANVLLWRQGDQWRGKVSDYGTANFMQHTMTAAPGAIIYIAPEALTSNQTVKVDVYSFGVLLCEMCIRELPDPERRDQQIAMVTKRLLRTLIRGCLKSEPEARPNMEEIIEELEEPV